MIGCFDLLSEIEIDVIANADTELHEFAIDSILGNY